jgi:hypothetical protein
MDPLAIASGPAVTSPALLDPDVSSKLKEIEPLFKAKSVLGWAFFLDVVLRAHPGMKGAWKALQAAIAKGDAEVPKPICSKMAATQSPGETRRLGFDRLEEYFAIAAPAYSAEVYPQTNKNRIRHLPPGVDRGKPKWDDNPQWAGPAPGAVSSRSGPI